MFYSPIVYTLIYVSLIVILRSFRLNECSEIMKQLHFIYFSKNFLMFYPGILRISCTVFLL